MTVSMTKEELLASNLSECLTPNMEVLNGLLSTFKPEVKDHIRATNQTPVEVAVTLVCMMSEYTESFEQAFNLMFGDNSWVKFLETMLEANLNK